MSEHGTYETIEGRPAVRFERRLAHPIEAVWRGITDPAELAHWFPCEVELDEVRAGAPMRFVFDPESIYDGQVLEADPPRVFAFLWGPDELRFELEAAGAHTVLRLLHVLREEGPDAAAKTAAGWHLCLDGLAGRLAGGPGVEVAEDGGPPPQWRERYEEYVARGVPSGAPVPER